MISVLIGVLIIIVVGAICFWAIEQLCVPKIKFGNIGGEVHREPAGK